VVADAKQEEGETRRQKEFEWRVKRTYFEDDEKKSSPVSKRSNVASAAASTRLNGNVAHCVAGTKKCNCAGRRVRKAVRQKVKELQKLASTDCAKSRREI